VGTWIGRWGRQVSSSFTGKIVEILTPGAREVAGGGAGALLGDAKSPPCTPRSPLPSTPSSNQIFQPAWPLRSALERGPRSFASVLDLLINHGHMCTVLLHPDIA
jgi:hypothetical protein